ncbi:hypothetical protein [Metabacillus malikii]|uniref:Glycine zipper-like domain-containing protein n=1 Tax=Metabacillus malikii TaxID=1504265 RepID=A0ABT9ZMD9_9BACI|nr:hypothetical protein [Metabacillus malikii]MDQ0232683.1 hypothetical protein [Metabacillus malikii]
MENNGNELKLIINKLKQTVDTQTFKKLELEKCERLVERLTSFSESCEECQRKFIEAEEHFSRLDEHIDQLPTSEMKEHKQFVSQTVAHFEKEHDLVTEGYYVSLYMSIGLGLGVMFGLTIFDNIGLGIPIGFAIGLAIGSGLDADAKKKGKTI